MMHYFKIPKLVTKSKKQQAILTAIPSTNSLRKGQVCCPKADPNKQQGSHKIGDYIE